MALFRRKGLTFRKQRKKLNLRGMLPAAFWVLQIAVMIVLANFTVGFWFQSTNMVGDAMSGTLSNEDIVFVNQVAYWVGDPERGDVIAFLPNGNIKSHYYIRRIAGVPGDTVQIVDGILYVNGEVQDTFTATEKIEVAGIADSEIVLEEDEYFVLGDNTNSSEDSRHTNIGTVKKSEMMGKIWFCIYPFTDMGMVK